MDNVSETSKDKLQFLIFVVTRIFLW